MPRRRRRSAATPTPPRSRRRSPFSCPIAPGTSPARSSTSPPVRTCGIDRALLGVVLDHLEDVVAFDFGPVHLQHVLLHLGHEGVEVVVANGDAAVAADELRHGHLGTCSGTNPLVGVRYRAP